MNNKINIQNLNVGQVCEHINSHKRYLIIDICKNFYECLAVTGIEKAMYIPKYIIKEDAILSNNQSLQGIKWFNENYNLDKLYENEVLNEIFEMQESYINKPKQLNKQKNKIYK